MTINRISKCEFIVTSTDDQLRIERFLNKYTKISKILFYKLLRNKDIKVNKKSVQQGYRVNFKDKITVYYNFELPQNITRKVDYKIIFNSKIFENQDILVLNKPINIATQGGTNQKTSIDDAIQNYCQNKVLDRYLIMHRLDLVTSGILFLAKSKIVKKIVKKIYLVILCGYLKDPIKVNKPLLKVNLKVIITPKGKESITHFTPIKYINGYTVTLAEIFTGRMHQIRVHAQSINLPILGDKKYYGHEAARVYIHALFSTILINNIKYNFVANIDQYFQKYISSINIYQHLINYLQS